jgi:guanyl-specific ribonuclease Sa
MERTPVSSSNISLIGYDVDSQILEIEFHGGSVYSSSGVPLGEYEGVINAESKGKYFHTNINNRYSFMKL